MRIIKIDSSNEDSFRYAILYSLHYYVIPRNPERIAKLDLMDNLNISLTVYDEHNKIIYSPNNYNTLNKAQVPKINNDRYAAIRPIKDNYIKLKELLQSFSRSELSNLRFQNI